VQAVIRMKKSKFFIIFGLIITVMIGIYFVYLTKFQEKEKMIFQNNTTKKDEIKKDNYNNVVREDNTKKTQSSIKKEVNLELRTQKDTNDDKKAKIEEFLKQIKKIDFSCSKENTECK